MNTIPTSNVTICESMPGKRTGTRYHSVSSPTKYIFCGEHLLCARLCSSNIDACDGVEEELERIFGQIHQRPPASNSNRAAGDTGYCRENLMRWCEKRAVYYLFGLAKNSRMLARIRKLLAKSARCYRQTGKLSRRFVQCRYRTRNS